MDSSVFGLRQRCHEQEQRITDLQSQISDMHVQLRSHTQAREELEATVEERDKALLEADRRVDELTSKMRMTENDKLVTDQQLHHCLQELERLKLSLQESDSQVQNLRDRKAAEKSVSVELRIENKRYGNLVHHDIQFIALVNSLSFHLAKDWPTNYRLRKRG